MSDYYGFLEQSPMFQFSLASKELFHSNFLYWLSLAEPDAFKQVVCGFGISCQNDIVVKREWEHFDISLVKTDEVGRVVDIVAVIENKVKSLPIEKQLKEYGKKIKKTDKIQECTKVLLSLSNPDFDTSKYGWTYVDYSKYLELVKSSICQVSNPYHKEILCDYCKMIEALCGLKESWSGDALLKREYKSIIDSQEDSLARKLRINDIRHKIIYSSMQHWLRTSLGESKEIVPGMNFTNSTGIVEVHITTNNGICREYGVQVQGCQYRRFVVTRKSNPEDDVCIGLINNVFPSSCLDVPNFTHDGKKQIGYFGKTFRYLYHKIPAVVTVEDVLDQMVTDVSYITNNFPTV